MVKTRKEHYAKCIEDIIKQFFKVKYEIPFYELMKIKKATLINLYHILNELKQKRLSDYR